MLVIQDSSPTIHRIMFITCFPRDFRLTLKSWNPRRGQLGNYVVYCFALFFSFFRSGPGSGGGWDPLHVGAFGSTWFGPKPPGSRVPLLVGQHQFSMLLSFSTNPHHLGPSLANYLLFEARSSDDVPSTNPRSREVMFTYTRKKPVGKASAHRSGCSTHRCFSPHTKSKLTQSLYFNLTNRG